MDRRGMLAIANNGPAKQIAVPIMPSVEADLSVAKDAKRNTYPTNGAASDIQRHPHPAKLNF